MLTVVEILCTVDNLGHDGHNLQQKIYHLKNIYLYPQKQKIQKNPKHNMRCNFFHILAIGLTAIEQILGKTSSIPFRQLIF